MRKIERERKERTVAEEKKLRLFVVGFASCENDRVGEKEKKVEKKKVVSVLGESANTIEALATRYQCAIGLAA